MTGDSHRVGRGGSVRREPGVPQAPRAVLQSESGVQMQLFGSPLLRSAAVTTAFLPERSSEHGRRNPRLTLHTARSIAGAEDLGATAARVAAGLAPGHCTWAQRHSNVTSTRAFELIRQIRP
jgi:hypothetical protein